MKRFLSLADRMVEPSLKFLATINVLFLASFLLVLLAAAGEARAEVAMSCGGKDLMSEFSPAEIEKIRSTADAAVNGKGTLWKIEKAGLEPSWLLGTMHMADPRVTMLSAKAQAAYDSADTVVIETTDVLDERKMMGQLGKEPELMMFTDGSTLTSKLSAGDAKALEAGLLERGIPIATVAKMKPWMLIAMVALPACEMARKAAGVPVLDAKLALEAQADGKNLEGLETASEQLRAMASLPMEFHIRGLIDTLKLGDRIDDVLETMIVLYKREDIGMFWPLLEASLGEAAGVGEGYRDFEQTMIVQRNHVMADRSQPILSKGSVFIAVGALHLAGQEGVIELLRANGFTLTRVQ